MSTPSGRGDQLLRVAGLASHRGTNLRHIDAACRTEGVRAELALLISNNSGSGIVDYARKNAIPWRHFSTRTHPDPTELDQAICDALVEHDIDVVFLSGYMKRLGPRTIERFRDHILNIHPSLLPRHGGQGMYGDRVYEAVLEAHEDRTGATVHLVDEEYDHGRVVMQSVVPVKSEDDVERLRNRVREAERHLCLRVISELASGRLDLGTLVGTGTGTA
ncbi:MAG: phosphoribosylglycinamide formyltransferase 1 [Actinomycetota bacterium]|nr:phosphoribosylglycinamide formyltransferase 1 [Actinomycetota bacterium]